MLRAIRLTRKVQTRTLLTLPQRIKTHSDLESNKGKYTNEFYKEVKNLIFKTNNHKLKLHLKNAIIYPTVSSLVLMSAFELTLNMLYISDYNNWIKILSLTQRLSFAPILSCLFIAEYNINKEFSNYKLKCSIKKELELIRLKTKNNEELEFIKNIENNLE